MAVDQPQALHWLRLAAAQDHPSAFVALDALDARGVGRGSRPALPDEFDAAGRPVSAVERRRDPRRWSQVGDPGDADQRYHLGVMFERGIGAPRDRARAQAWYALSAKQGDARAQAALARLLEPTDIDAALGWYQQAADQGERAAQLALGRLYSSGGDDPHQAFKGMLWYARACESGEPLALLTLGHLLSSTQEHIAHDCFRRAAEQAWPKLSSCWRSCTKPAPGCPRTRPSLPTGTGAPPTRAMRRRNVPWVCAIWRAAASR